MQLAWSSLVLDDLAEGDRQVNHNRIWQVGREGERGQRVLQTWWLNDGKDQVDHHYDHMESNPRGRASSQASVTGKASQKCWCISCTDRCGNRTHKVEKKSQRTVKVCVVQSVHITFPFCGAWRLWNQTVSCMRGWAENELTLDNDRIKCPATMGEWRMEVITFQLRRAATQPSKKPICGKVNESTRLHRRWGPVICNFKDIEISYCPWILLTSIIVTVFLGFQHYVRSTPYVCPWTWISKDSRNANQNTYVYSIN